LIDARDSIGAPTLDDVVGLWNHLSSHYGSEVVPKSESPVMRICSGALSLLRIQTRSEFMERYTTVINRRIYLPFAHDPPGTEATLWSRIATGIHEHQHVVQARRDGFLRFAASYLSSERARALYEAEAYGTELELMRWAGRGSRTPESIAAGLASYGCGERAREVALAELRTYEAAEKIRTEATQVGVAWLNERLRVATGAPQA
jgi:hypothetical protein